MPDKNDCPVNNFGHLEGDIGICVDCSVENKDLFNVCWDETHRNSKSKKKLDLTKLKTRKLQQFQQKKH